MARSICAARHRVLCGRPSARHAGRRLGRGGFAVVALMWAAMTLAMMLPSAAPMILTYAEIADTAARKGERIVSPFVLAAGYTLVWLGFAGAATLAQFAFTRAALLDTGMASASGLFSGAIFIGAGVYQFSALKHACLTQCRSPFPFFFANWATTPRGVFRLGVKQGLYCLGCCWAMMLVMFAVGVMNVIWMAALGMRDDDGEDRHRQALHLRRRRRADRGRRRLRADGVRGPLAAARDLS